MSYLSPHFTEEEFRCKCGCGACSVSLRFLFRLEAARSLYQQNVPGGVFVINSGCRCPDHNEAEGGNENSQHIVDLQLGRECNAADIKCTFGLVRYYMVKALFDAGFIGIGVADTYIHCDMGLYQPHRPALWSY